MLKTSPRPQNISIHALREEGDATELLHLAAEEDFYPRPPRGGRQQRPKNLGRAKKFLSTPSARRATAKQKRFLSSPQFLSTPSARRATRRTTKVRRRAKISIHALREEGDVGLPYRSDGIAKFLSTPSARRATT